MRSPFSPARRARRHAAGARHKSIRADHGHFDLGFAHVRAKRPGSSVACASSSPAADFSNMCDSRSALLDPDILACMVVESELSVAHGATLKSPIATTGTPWTASRLHRIARQRSYAIRFSPASVVYIAVHGVYVSTSWTLEKLTTMVLPSLSTSSPFSPHLTEIGRTFEKKAEPQLPYLGVAKLNTHHL